MAYEDKVRWNEKYLSMDVPTTPIRLVEDFYHLSSGKQALDVACGLGRHAKFVAQKGYFVDALDISSVAIEKLQNIDNINPYEVDFDTYTFTKEKYDLAICTYFLDRKLFSQIHESLKEGGVLLYETFVYHPENERVPKNRDFLLEPGELEREFGDQYTLLHMQESWGRDGQGYKSLIGSMVAKKNILADV
ncbi:MAG: methyltransferase domain-containing protein [Epsilonproteobacteria bacterium]|nr:methyltransferase domain-containing protein [Campylobacterota bacterium]